MVPAYQICQSGRTPRQRARCNKCADPRHQRRYEGLRLESARAGSVFSGLVNASVRAAAMGHSFGGASAIVAAERRPDLFAALATLAATPTSPQAVDILAAMRAANVPALHLGASRDTIVPPPANLDVLYAATPTTRRLIEIEGGTHSYFHERWAIDRLVESPRDDQRRGATALDASLHDGVSRSCSARFAALARRIRRPDGQRGSGSFAPSRHLARATPLRHRGRSTGNSLPLAPPRSAHGSHRSVLRRRRQPDLDTVG